MALTSIVIIVCFVHISDGIRINTPYSSLTQFLLDGYDKQVFPVNRTNDVLKVDFSISLYQIDELDERHQTISLTAHIQQSWYNLHLSWNPSDYDGITDIRLPADKVWLPDTVLYHNVDEENRLIASDLNVLVSYDGYVTLVVPSMLRSSCQVNVAYVPFDTQRCFLHFASWSYNKDLLTFVNNTVLRDNYKDNGEWGLVSTSMVPFVARWTLSNHEMEGASLVLVLKRHSHYCVLFKVVPFILVAAVSLLVFLLPVDSGEKISLVITNLLTLVLFYVEISQYFPGKDFPYLGGYFFVIVCVVVLSCVMTVWVITTYHSQRPVPYYIHNLFFGHCGLHRFVWYVPTKKDASCRRRSSSRGSHGKLAKLPPLELGVNQRDLPGNYSMSCSSPKSELPMTMKDKIFQRLLNMQYDISLTLHRIERMESHLGTGRNERENALNDGFETLSEWKIIAIIMDQLFFLITTVVTLSTCTSFILTLVYEQDMEEMYNVTMDM
ncbi:neuronal acetylcholine receptor subunit non-alpha-2-like [Glandiceps talaboti]